MARQQGAGAIVTGTTAVLGMALIAAGVWALAAPGSFAGWAGSGEHALLVRDLAALQLGFGAVLLLALLWGDPPATALAGLLLVTALWTGNHATALDRGGATWRVWLFGGVSVAVAVVLYLRIRGNGFVLGRVSAAGAGELAAFARQKTIVLTTYRRDGTPGRTPVSIAVDGDRAYLRSFEKALKTSRLARDPRAEIARSDGLGRTVSGPCVPGRMRRLDGEAERHAARLLRDKYPLLHGLLVPVAHRILRNRTGRTVHFEFTSH